MSSADSPKKKVKKIVIISGVVVLLCAAVWMCLRQRQKKPVNTVPGNVISTAKVERRDLSNSVSVTGSIESVDFRTVTSEVKDVKVSEVLAGVGEYVEEGQVIARFDTSELEEKLAKCRSNYTVNQTLDSIKNSPLDTYNEALEKAAKNYSETETAYHTKAAEYQTANNACEEAYQEALRQFGIAGGAEDARGQLEAAIASMTQEDAAYQQKNAAAKAWESAKQNLSGIESSFVSAETAMIRGKEAYDEEVKKAKQTYDEAVLSKQLISSDSDLEKIEEYEKQIEKCEIKAPVSGVIASIGVKENDTFSGGTVFTMLDNEHFKVTASVDEVKLTLALSNLVENAITYHKEHGFVKVTLDADHQFFTVKVEDSGVGIPKEALEHIYERFYRVDKSRSREIGGTGLGLAITRSAILMHRGSIKVASIEGEGTDFTVKIPLKYIAV